jgi:hypothetical protein
VIIECSLGWSISLDSTYARVHPRARARALINTRICPLPLNRTRAHTILIITLSSPLVCARENASTLTHSRINSHIHAHTHVHPRMCTRASQKTDRADERKISLAQVGSTRARRALTQEKDLQRVWESTDGTCIVVRLARRFNEHAVTTPCVVDRDNVMSACSVCASTAAGIRVIDVCPTPELRQEMCVPPRRIGTSVCDLSLLLQSQSSPPPPPYRSHCCTPTMSITRARAHTHTHTHTHTRTADQMRAAFLC